MTDGNSPVSIYGLIDARVPGNVRYVGHTSANLTGRLCSHISVARAGRRLAPVYRWIREVGEEYVDIVLIETVAYRDRFVRERYSIETLGTLVSSGGLNSYVPRLRC